MKKFTKPGPTVTPKEEPRVEGTNLEALSCILQGPRREGPAVIAPGGVFKATPEQVKKLVGDKSAKRTNRPASTDKELGILHAAHVNKQRKTEAARLEEIRRSNS